MFLKKITNFNKYESDVLLKINPLTPLLFVIFWVYGYFGAFGRDFLIDTKIQVIFLAYISLLVTLLIWFLGNKKDYLIKILLSRLDIAVFILIFIFWLIIANWKLNLPFSQDHFYYSFASKAHERALIDVLSNFINIENHSYKSIVNIFSIFLFFSISVFFYLFLKTVRRNVVVAFLMFVLALIVSRIIVIKFGGGQSVHPPFQYFPIWLSSTFLGFNEYSFRFAQLIALILLNASIYIFLLRVSFDKFSALIASISICYFPTLIHTSTLVESSIWTSFLWSAIILFFWINRNVYLENKYLFFLNSLIAIISLMRAPAFIIIFLSIVTYINQHKNIKNILDIKNLYVFVPILIIIPFFLQSFILGTPATFIGNEADTSIFFEDESFIGRVLYAISEGYVLGDIVNNSSLIWLIFLTYFFLDALLDKSNLGFNFFLIIFLLVAILIFYSIRPILWGHDRYIAEFIYPFMSIGLFKFYTKIYGLNNNFFRNILIILTSSFIIIFSQIEYKIYPEKFFKATKEQNIHTENPFNYDEAFKEFNKSNMKDRIFYAGISYGVPVYVLSDYSVKEINKIKKLISRDYSLNHSSDWLNYDPQKINNNKDISVVFITDINNADFIASQLLNLGWQENMSFDETRNLVKKTRVLIRDDKSQ